MQKTKSKFKWYWTNERKLEILYLKKYHKIEKMLRTKNQNYK